MLNRLLLFAALGAAALPAGALEVRCEPAHPFFCLNIHAGCAGLTEVATFPFELHAIEGRGWIASGAERAGIQEQYQGGRAEWGGDDTRVIVWPAGGPGYVRLLTDGKYVFRHYVRDTGVMSYGYCR
jgi:hypothetical protein